MIIFSGLGGRRRRAFHLSDRRVLGYRKLQRANGKVGARRGSACEREIFCRLPDFLGCSSQRPLPLSFGTMPLIFCGACFTPGHKEAEFMCVCDIGKENHNVIEDLNNAQVSERVHPFDRVESNFLE